MNESYPERFYRHLAALDAPAEYKAPGGLTTVISGLLLPSSIFYEDSGASDRFSLEWHQSHQADMRPAAHISITRVIKRRHTLGRVTSRLAYDVEPDGQTCHVRRKLDNIAEPRTVNYEGLPPLCDVEKLARAEQALQDKINSEPASKLEFVEILALFRMAETFQWPKTEPRRAESG